MPRSAPVDDFTLAYERSGSGPVVVLLHGWPGDRGDYRAVAPLRTAPDRVRALVLAPPLPGADERALGAVAQREFWYRAGSGMAATSLAESAPAPADRPRGDRLTRPEVGRFVKERARRRPYLRAMLTNHSTGIARIDAHEDFARARRAHLAARTVGWVAGRGRARRPRVYCDSALLPGGAPHLEVIALDAVVGTLEPTLAFDDRFRPASDLVRARWERVALAHRRGIALPPISVRRGPDGYYVVDGRHRVSVARALGRRDIEAWVTDARPLAAAPLACAA